MKLPGSRLLYAFAPLASATLHAQELDRFLVRYTAEGRISKNFMGFYRMELTENGKAVAVRRLK